MSKMFSAHPAQVPKDRRFKLGPLVIDRDDAEALARMSEETGAPASWHRRKAIAEYVQRAREGGSLI